DAERGKDKDEDKNIINAQAPFKQVSAEIFECRLSAHFNEYKNKECHGKAHPKKSLIEGLLYRDGLILFAQQSQVKHQSQYQHTTKHKISDEIIIHFQDSFTTE